MGAGPGRALLQRPVNVIVKLHDRSRDLRERYSGGVDWVAALRPLMQGREASIAPGHDICPYLVAVGPDDHRPQLRRLRVPAADRPLVRIHRPELLATGQHPSRLRRICSASVSDSTRTLEQTLAAVETRRSPIHAPLSATRRAVAADLFYRPGGATARSVGVLYEAIELEGAPAGVTAQEAACQP